MTHDLIAKLTDALFISNRTAKGLASVLRQLYAGELDRIDPEEKEAMINFAFNNHHHAATIADDLLKKVKP